MVAALLNLLTALAAWSAPVTNGTRFPSNEEQYTLQLINQARTSGSGLAILQRLVSNNLTAIVPSTTATSQDGTPWSLNFWTSPIPGVASNMNYFRVHPGNLKRQFMDLAIPNYPLAWNANLGNVASGYNAIVIASQGGGAGFPHNLNPYQDSSTFEAYAKRYLDGGYGPLNDLVALAENLAPNSLNNALFRFASLMIDWGNTPNGIQDQNPATGSHRLSIMADDFTEVGISALPGWTTGNVSEAQEFGQRASRHVRLTGAVFVDSDADGFYKPGEGSGGITVTATSSSTGASTQTTTTASGGYALELNTPGTYSISVGGALWTVSPGPIVVGDQNVLLNVTAPASAAITGSVSVKLGTSAAVAAGAMWQVDNSGLFRASETTVEGLTPGTHTVSFKAISGWLTPLSQIVTVAANQTTQITATYISQSSQISDLNKDGIDDVLWQNTVTGQLAGWLMNGNSQSGNLVWIYDNPPPDWRVAAMADLNRDGIPDIIWQNVPLGMVGATLMNGSSGISSILMLATSGVGNWRVAGSLDVNRDEIPDILWQNAVTGQAKAWIMNGAGQMTREAWVYEAQLADWKVVATGDINRDGITDILWQNVPAGQVVATVMDSAGQIGSLVWIATSGLADRKVAGMADLNRDGIPDILWQNTVGNVTAWIMDGAGRSNSVVTLYANATGDWRINGKK